ncbi:hypothetical protein [Blautia hydrogenotrophica]|uniref:hypothetical protein n=1 Tax=Blautia hydrogenotrophica TaxID=53443 RepID=UPI002E79A77E|nr:hypothetical protein [Blautia hydrogenotrophica]MEE0462401.1 hypothetical protein [Blautia hydrogenotrophica]
MNKIERCHFMEESIKLEGKRLPVDGGAAAVVSEYQSVQEKLSRQISASEGSAL